MSSLSALLESPRRSLVTKDLSELATQSVSEQSGITGTVLKTGLATARKVDSEIVSKSVNRLLPDFVSALQPLWTDYRKNEQATDFGSYLEQDKERAMHALLEVADHNAESASSASLRKVYSSVRGKAEKILEPHLPKIGRIIEKHAKN